MPELPLTIVPVVLDEDVDEKTYYFYVPNDYEVVQGARVQVLTSKGVKEGTACRDSRLYYSDEQPPFKVSCMKPVLMISQPTCCIVDIPLRKIVVPECFAQSYPTPEKLLKKYQLFLINPTRLPPVQLDCEYVLVDGYITYLLHRMFGRKTVPCSFRSARDIRNEMKLMEKVEVQKKKIEQKPQEEKQQDVLREIPEEASEQNSEEVTFKPGDIVRVRDKLTCGVGGYIGEDMDQFLGKYVTIKNIDNTFSPATYSFEEDSRGFLWESCCFEPVAKKA